MSKRYGTTEERFWKQVSRGEPDACWPWLGQTHKGYGRFRLVNHRGVDRVRVSAHRFAYSTVHGDVPEDLVVRHTCNNPPCCNPRHLAAGTQAENIADKMVAGTCAKGDANGARTKPETLHRGSRASWAKLTEDKVREARARWVRGVYGQRRLAAEYGVSEPTMREALLGITWRHVV